MERKQVLLKQRLEYMDSRATYCYHSSQEEWV